MISLFDNYTQITQQQPKTGYSVYKLTAQQKSKKNTLNGLFPPLPNKKYDIIYIDPPYKKQQNIKLIEKLEACDLVNEDGIIVIESLQEKIWPEKIASYSKYKEKTYGITRISYYRKEEK